MPENVSERLSTEAEESAPKGALPGHHERKRNFFTRWAFGGARLDLAGDPGEHPHPWYMVIWLTGVDYFSTLGYQPGIALLAAGAIAPVATTLLVLVTLLCALPVYAQVAGRSYAGQGSIAMLENLAGGWKGRIFVLVLLGFAATDFVITMTLSAADAAQHAVENPYLSRYLGEHAMTITIALLALLALVFLKGFKEAIGFASFVTVPYLILNAFVLIRCGMLIFSHPEMMHHWESSLFSGTRDFTGIALAAALVFPRLALGLSGFETGVSVMPLISGDEKDADAGPPKARIRNTRKMLATAAAIMSVMLIASSVVTAILIPESAYKEGGEASGRAIAYLAHKYIGNEAGTIYDMSTILILWFAGASAMAGLLNLIPRYLPRLGMAPLWVAYSRPLVLVLFAIDVAVTLVFRANVDAQGGAYATGVLVLMLSGAFAASLALWHEGRKALSLYCWVVVAIFAYTTISNVFERPDGIIIASIFIAAIIVIGFISRYRRATELRVSELTFCDPESERMFGEITGKKIALVPVRTMSHHSVEAKRREIQSYYKETAPFAFLTVELIDNRSEFLEALRVRVRRENGDYLILVSGANTVANTIAFISEMLHPISMYLTLTTMNQMSQAIRFVLVGEGEIGLMLYTILLRHWESTPEEDERPYIFLMSC